MKQLLQRWLAVAILSVAALSPAAAQRLPPFKDGFFSYPPLVLSEFNGDYRVFAYDPLRDAAGQNMASGTRVTPQSVSLAVRRDQRDLITKTSAGRVAHIAVGERKGASLIVVYLHGQGANRTHGAHDFLSGGNFNRIKNLVVQAGGLYLSPDFADFEAKGTGQVAALIQHYAVDSPGAPVFVACGSAGGAICYGLAENPAIVPLLGGILMLGSFPDERFLTSAGFRRGVPILLAHGVLDKIFAVEWVEAFFQMIRDTKPGYPVKMVSFEEGTHGAPLRLVDWRETINWMLSLRYPG
ncbi:phospholipase [Acuticoccus kandeliae]|uniref:phospholipase n=1 Tax=Acuticoccus kandeliae TaxID=2073160 RepID=UPI000D3E884A|nr:phospholipase [Acuticoccus kandeliae]